RRKYDALFREEPPDRIDRRLSLHGGDGFQQGDFFWADFLAVAGFAAVGDAAFVHHRVEPLVLKGGARRVIVEEPHLADDRGADELVHGRVLRARLQTASATDAAR